MAKSRMIIRCVGLGPILMNAIPAGLLVNLAKGISTPKKKGADLNLDDIAGEKLYLDDDGTPCIPRQNMFAALKYAGKFVKQGKKNITTADTTMLPSLLTVEPSLIRLDGGKPGTKVEYVTDMRAGRHRQGATKVMVALVRPRIDNWGLTVPVTFDGEDGTVRTIKQLFIEAGDKSGLGDHRPSSGGFSGRFKPVGYRLEVIHEEVSEEVLEAGMLKF